MLAAQPILSQNKTPMVKPENNPAILRDVAFQMEDALDKGAGKKGIHMSRGLALVTKRALFDLADRIEREDGFAGS